MDVEPGEIHRLEGPDRGPARAEPVGERAVDVLEGTDPRVDERVGLAEERVLQAVDDKSGHVEADDHGCLAELLDPALERGEGLARRSVCADDLHDLDELGRVEEVEAREALGMLQVAADLGERERRGVGGEDRIGRGDLLGAREDRALRLRLLDDRLDDEVGAGECLVEVGRHADGVSGPLAGGIEAGLAPRVQPDGSARIREHAGDPGTHRAGTDDGDFARTIHPPTLARHAFHGRASAGANHSFGGSQNALDEGHFRLGPEGGALARDPG